MYAFIFFHCELRSDPDSSFSSAERDPEGKFPDPEHCFVWAETENATLRMELRRNRKPDDGGDRSGTR